MRISDKEGLFAAALVLVVGVGVAVSGIPAVIEVSREHPGVSRFVLGYSLLWAGVGILIQRSHRKTLVNVTRSALDIVARGRDKQAPDQSMQSGAADGGGRG